LLFIVSGARFISKKIKEQGFLGKSHQKTYPLDPVSEIRDPEKIHPGTGSRIQDVKKHRIRIRNTGQRNEKFQTHTAVAASISTEAAGQSSTELSEEGFGAGDDGEGDCG
jgi:hypothetical protein